MTRIGYHKGFIIYELLYYHRVDVPDDILKQLLKNEEDAKMFGNPWPLVMENILEDFDEEN